MTEFNICQPVIALDETGRKVFGFVKEIKQLPLQGEKLPCVTLMIWAEGRMFEQILECVWAYHPKRDDLREYMIKASPPYNHRPDLQLRKRQRISQNPPAAS